MKTTEITKRGIQVEIAERVSKGEITTADELAEQYGVTYTQAVSLLGNPQFITIVSSISKAKAQLAWHSIAVPKLIAMLKSEDDKVSLQAMKMLGQLTDNTKGADFNINISLEKLVRDAETEKPVSNNLKPEDVDNVIEITNFRKVMEED